MSLKNSPELMLNDKVKGSEAAETLPLIEDGRESRGTQSTPSSQNTKQEAWLWEEKLKFMENDFRKPKWRKKHFQLIPGNSGNWTRNLLRDRQKIYQRPKPVGFFFLMLFVFTVSLTLWKTSDQGLRQRVLHPFPQISSRVTSLIPHNKWQRTIVNYRNWTKPS